MTWGVLCGQVTSSLGVLTVLAAWRGRGLADRAWWPRGEILLGRCWHLYPGSPGLCRKSLSPIYPVLQRLLVLSGPTGPSLEARAGGRAPRQQAHPVRGQPEMGAPARGGGQSAAGSPGNRTEHPRLSWTARGSSRTPGPTFSHCCPQGGSRQQTLEVPIRKMLRPASRKAPWRRGPLCEPHPALAFSRPGPPSP